MFRIVSRNSVVMPPLPVWPAGARVPANYAEFADVLRRHSPRVDVDFATDAAYVQIPHTLLAPAISVTLARLRADDVGYTKNAWDCEDFTTEVCQTLRKCAERAGIELAPIIGQIHVFQLHPWATVRAGGTHALGALDTDRGPVVIEPQNGTHTPLELYPNRTTLIRARGF